MGKVQRWKDVPVSANITLERVRAEELPSLLGRSGSLDIQIAKLLQTEGRPQVLWLWDIDNLIEIDLPSEYSRTFEIEAEVEGTSTGMYDPGKQWGPPDTCYPPEEEDERIITDLTLVIYDEEGEELGKYKPEDLSDFDSFEAKLYEEDLDLNEF